MKKGVKYPIEILERREVEALLETFCVEHVADHHVGPSPASARAIASPMLREPPLTRPTLPSSRFISLLLSSCRSGASRRAPSLAAGSSRAVRCSSRALAG
jgi:hypothetical protein